MSTELQIVVWNLHDGINEPQIQQSVLDIEPDVAIFPEAHAESDKLDQATCQRFTNAGYHLYEKDYDDDDGRKDRHALVVAVKPELVRVAEAVRLVSRTAIRLTLHDGIEVMGVHLDDRRVERRVQQAEVAIRSLDWSAIVGGDFNDMFSRIGQARLLRLARPLNVLPAREPEPGRSTSKLSYAQRLNGMAQGKAMAAFAEAGFKDADPAYVPTMTKKMGPLTVRAQLDHLLYRGTMEAAYPTVVEDMNNLSDHKRIRATFEVK